ncbi:MAG: MFS transporter [Acidobacteriota bacterium]
MNETDTKSAEERQFGRLGVLAWAHFMNDGCINYLPGILPLLLERLSVPLALSGSLILALQGLGSLLQPVAGWWADRCGGRAFVVGGLVLSVLGGSVLGLAPDYWALIAILVFAGLGNAAFHPQALAGARQIAGKRAGLTLSVFLVGGELGRSLWPTLAGLVVAWLGLHGLWIVALPGALTVLLLARAAPSLPVRPAQPLGGAFRAQRAAVWALVGFVGLRALVSYGVSIFVPLLWHAKGGSLLGGASLITVMLGVGIVGNLAGGALADRIGRRPVLVGSSVLSGLFLALFLLASGAWLWLLLGLLGMATFATAAVTMLVGQDLFPHHHSMASGLALGVGNAAGAAAVFLLGFVAGRFGLHAALWSIVALAFLGIPLALVLPERPAAA